MSVLAPLAFWFASAIPVVVFFYLLKRKRIVKIVSSTLLWQRFLAETRASAPFQRLRRNWLLILQLLVLILAVFALARPVFSTQRKGRALQVVLLDASASMQSVNVDPNRFERARRLALDLVDGLEDADQMVVLLASRTTRVIQSPTSDKTVLRRAVAFTSDAGGKWARHWLTWGQYRQFWSQVARWSLRRIQNADLTTEVWIEKGIGRIQVEAVDAEGGFRNLLDLRATVVAPRGEAQPVRLEQTAPGRYEARFQTSEIGAYTLNLEQWEEGVVTGMRTIGASMNASPEYAESEPDPAFLERVAKATGGRVFKSATPEANPFLHDRRTTFQPLDLWAWLVKAAILLFPLDVALRRVQLDREELGRAWHWMRSRFGRFRAGEVAPDQGSSVAAVLSRRHRVGGPRGRAQPTRPRTGYEEAQRVSGGGAVKGRVKEIPPEKKKVKPAPKGPGGGTPAAAKEKSTARRLLEAKRAAQRKRGREGSAQE